MERAGRNIAEHDFTVGFKDLPRGEYCHWQRGRRTDPKLGAFEARLLAIEAQLLSLAAFRGIAMERLDALEDRPPLKPLQVQVEHECQTVDEGTTELLDL